MIYKKGSITGVNIKSMCKYGGQIYYESFAFIIYHKSTLCVDLFKVNTNNM